MQHPPRPEGRTRDYPADPPDDEAPAWSPIIELRQYTLHPGQRDVLIDLFDATFLDPMEALGVKVIGEFRDLDNPDKFVWLRGFPSMDARAEMLAAFYDGPDWRANRDAANATMIDSDDVLLLRAAVPGSTFRIANTRSESSSPDLSPGGPVNATILSLAPGTRDAEAISFFEKVLAPLIGWAGRSVLAYFVSETSENSFPRLPIRLGEHVFVWFDSPDDAGLSSGGEYPTAELVTTARNTVRRTALSTPGLIRPPQCLRLLPTGRSLLRAGTPACASVRRSPNPTAA
jgi:NIPSNAP protein